MCQQCWYMLHPKKMQYGKSKTGKEKRCSWSTHIRLIQIYGQSSQRVRTGKYDKHCNFHRMVPLISNPIVLAMDSVVQPKSQTETRKALVVCDTLSPVRAVATCLQFLRDRWSRRNMSTTRQSAAPRRPGYNSRTDMELAYEKEHRKLSRLVQA